MSFLGKSAATKGLVRKLLLKVHPDVVASISDSARTHNERALKSLLAHLNGTSAVSGPWETISFYLKDGGQTKSVKLDPRNPEKAVKMLLGLPADADDDAHSGPSSSGGNEKSWGYKGKSKWHRSEELTKEEREELAKAFRESLEQWWTVRDLILSDLDRLFDQNRVRYVGDAFETSAEVDMDMDELELKRSVDLVRQTFEFHVDDTTLRALQLPQLSHLDFVIVGRNLRDPEFKRQTLYVPLTVRPEVFGSAVDTIVQLIVIRATAAAPATPQKKKNPK